MRTNLPNRIIPISPKPASPLVGRLEPGSSSSLWPPLCFISSLLLTSGRRRAPGRSSPCAARSSTGRHFSIHTAPLASLHRIAPPLLHSTALLSSAPPLSFTSAPSAPHSAAPLLFFNRLPPFSSALRPTAPPQPLLTTAPPSFAASLLPPLLHLSPPAAPSSSPVRPRCFTSLAQPLSPPPLPPTPSFSPPLSPPPPSSSTRAPLPPPHLPLPLLPLRLSLSSSSLPAAVFLLPRRPRFFSAISTGRRRSHQAAPPPLHHRRVPPLQIHQAATSSSALPSTAHRRRLTDLDGDDFFYPNISSTPPSSTDGYFLIDANSTAGSALCSIFPLG